MADMRSHSSLFLSSEDAGSGGLMLIVRKTFSSSLELHSIIPGRIAYVTADVPVPGRHDHVRLNLINIHNFGINAAMLDDADEALQSLIQASLLDFENVITWIAGDMNFLAQGESRTHIHDPAVNVHERNNAKFL